MSSLHPFDPITPSEIEGAVKLLNKSFPGVKLRFKLVDINEPVKKDAIPYIEAERLGKPLPAPPARIIQSLFHRLDSGVFMKAFIDSSAGKILMIKELSKEIQVRRSSVGNTRRY